MRTSSEAEPFTAVKPFLPKPLLHLEGAAVLIGACFVYHELGSSWWRFAALFLAPDLFMLGYVWGTKVGAVAYNLGHTYAVPAAIALIAWLTHSAAALPICVIWVAHIGFDRLLGYGLKYPSAFKETHLARV